MVSMFPTQPSQPKPSYTVINHTNVPATVADRFIASVTQLGDTYYAVVNPIAQSTDPKDDVRWDDFHVSVCDEEIGIHTISVRLQAFPAGEDSNGPYPAGSGMLVEEIDVRRETWIMTCDSPDGSELLITGALRPQGKPCDEAYARMIARACDAVTAALRHSASWVFHYDEDIVCHVQSQGEPVMPTAMHGSGKRGAA